MDSSDAPWADAPFTLIPTPGRGENVNKLDDIVWIAREMANAHNGMLRALNSIYQQCVYVKEPKDMKDLLLYVGFWCDWIHEHHEGEETFLFPRVEEITGVEGLMEVNIAQHHTFMDGLEELQKYAKETKAGEYDGVKLRGIIDSFGANLTKHLTEEIETLLGLKKYDGLALKKAFVGFDDEMRKGDKVNRMHPFRVGVLIYGRVHCFQSSLVHRTYTMKEAWIGLKFQGPLKHWCITGLRGNTREHGGFVLRPLGGSADSYSSQ
jgi:hemerythrin-like domain-containing protein